MRSCGVDDVMLEVLWVLMEVWAAKIIVISNNEEKSTKERKDCTSS
jgi:hypothetical protein